jgi:hypothetical protein
MLAGGGYGPDQDELARTVLSLRRAQRDIIVRQRCKAGSEPILTDPSPEPDETEPEPDDPSE